MDKIRTFIAVCLPDEIKEKLSEIEEQLRKCGADFKWVPPENLHITLKFLGPVAADRIDAVEGAVGKAVEGMMPFDMQISGLGAFPKPSRPSILWAGVICGVENLRALAENLNSALEMLGFVREERSFTPHITLGRVKSTRNIGSLFKEIKRFSCQIIGSFEANVVAVMRSDLHPEGSKYTALREFKLG